MSQQRCVSGKGLVPLFGATPGKTPTEIEDSRRVNAQRKTQNDDALNQSCA